MKTANTTSSGIKTKLPITKEIKTISFLNNLKINTQMMKIHTGIKRHEKSTSLILLCSAL